jgi:site-specific recombinase XerC
MSANTLPLGVTLASFFNDHLKLQRGLRPNSITSYADAMRLFLQFAAANGKKKVSQLGLDDLHADVVCQFLNSLEESRCNAPQSRNQRLASLRTFFEYIGQRFPERLGQSQKVAAIPRKRAQPSETIFLERDEIEGTLAALPTDGRSALRDRALLGFFTIRVPVYKKPQTSAQAMFTSIRLRACVSARSGRKPPPCLRNCYPNRDQEAQRIGRSSSA